MRGLKGIITSYHYLDYDLLSILDLLRVRVRFFYRRFLLLKWILNMSSNSSNRIPAGLGGWLIIIGISVLVSLANS